MVRKRLVFWGGKDKRPGSYWLSKIGKVGMKLGSDLWLLGFRNREPVLHA